MPRPSSVQGLGPLSPICTSLSARGLPSLHGGCLDVPDIKNLVHVHTLVRHCLFCKTGVCLVLIHDEPDTAVVQDVPYQSISNCIVSVKLGTW